MNMNEMMAQMTEKMMETMMQSMMQSMMNSMMATIAPKEQEEVKPKKTVRTMTKEEFFALEEDSKPTSDLSSLDFEPVSAKSLRYNGYVPSDIWTVNHIAITQKYGGRWSGKLKAYTFPTHTDAVNFAQSYKIKTELDDNDRQNIKTYKAERAKAKAEYYAKKAAEAK